MRKIFEKFKVYQLPILFLWWFNRSTKQLYWNIFHHLLGSLKFKKIGKNVKFNGNVKVEHPFSDIIIGDNSLIGYRCYMLARPFQGYIHLGKSVTINANCFITSCYGIEIGNNVSIAENVSIRDYNHVYENTTIPHQQQGFLGAPISIGDDTWIGRGVMITAGVNIGKGCVIGANAVVTKDVPDYSIAVGIPARIIKSRI